MKLSPHPHASGLRSQASSPAFTTVELLISMALMIVAMVGVVGVFNIGSGSASKTAAHAELLASSAAIHDEVAHQLAHIVPGLLVIDSPPPTRVRAETPNGPKWLRLRHDRLVFIASGAPNEYQSFTDPTRGIPGSAASERAEPFASQEALIYFGPGIPVLADGTIRPIDGASPDQTLTASEWTFAHRSILLMQGLTEPPAPTPPWVGPVGLNIHDLFVPSSGVGMLTGGPLDVRFLQGRADVVFSDGIQRANAQAIIDAVRYRPFADFQALWQANWTPVTAKLTDVVASADFYTRSGFTFMPRMADLRIEWTDGRRIDPNGPDDDPTSINDNDSRTRWFGLAPDQAASGSPPDPANPASVDGMLYQARMRSIESAGNPSNPNVPSPGNPDNPPAETAAFANIEYAYNGSGSIGVTPDVDAGYRAVWRIDNWQFRPKALRLTYRLYDAGLRIEQQTTADLNENGIADPDNLASKTPVKRYGQEFSIVVSVP